MQSRQAIMEEIDKVLARSARLTEQAKARARGNVEQALSGSGFGDSEKRSLSKTIPPANTAFRKGGVADTFGSTGHESDALFPQGQGEVHQFSGEELVAAGPKPSSDYYDRFSEAMASQYPTIPEMHGIKSPVPSSSFEQRFSQSSAPRYEPTSGPPIIASPDKARLTTMQKISRSMTPVQKLVALFDIYSTGGDLKLAKSALNIR